MFAYFLHQRISLDDTLEVLSSIEQTLESGRETDAEENPILTLLVSILMAYARWARTQNATSQSTVPQNIKT